MCMSEYEMSYAFELGSGLSEFFSGHSRVECMHEYIVRHT
jgi:hypothetical protein